MNDDNETYLKMTLEQCLRHGERSIRTFARDLQSELESVAREPLDKMITVSDMLQHRKTAVRILSEALFQELKTLALEQERERLQKTPEPKSHP